MHVYSVKLSRQNLCSYHYDYVYNFLIIISISAIWKQTTVKMNTLLP